MAHIGQVVALEEQISPAFKVVMCNMAHQYNINPELPTSKQTVNDNVIIDFMKELYPHAYGSLRATGKPPPGKRSKLPPCDQDKIDKLLSTVDLSHFQGAVKKKYQDLIVQNHDMFSL